MKQRSLLILSITVLLFASCGNKGGKSGLLVPKDAAVVVHINSASLSSKLSWNEIRQTNWFKAMQDDVESTDTLAKRLLDDPSSSGVDTKQDFVMFIRKHGKGSYMVFEGSLTDRAVYEQLLAEMTKKKPKEIKKAGEFSYMVPDEKSVVLWNKSKFAVVTNANAANSPMAGGGFMRKRRSTEEVEFTTDSLRIFGEQALTLEGGNNLDSDSRFADLVKNGSDVHIWINAEHYAGKNPFDFLPVKINTDPWIKGSISAMSVNFDNGKITAKSKQYYSEEMNKILANNKPQPISADVINRIPSSNVVAVMAFNYSPKSLKEMLGLMGVEAMAMADMFLSTKLNFSIDEFVKANKGEVLLAVSGPAPGQSPDTAKRRTFFSMFGDINVLFATAVNDKAAFEKMLAAAETGLKLKKGGSGMDEGMEKDMNNGPGNTGIPGINYKIENNWFAVSNTVEFRDKFLAGGNSKLPFVNKISGHPVGMYVDLQKITQWFGSVFGRSSDSVNSSNIWQDIVATGGDYKDKSTEFEFEINLVDKNTNSLKQLNQYINKMFTMRPERPDKMAMENMNNVPVPLPPVSQTK